MIGVLDPALLLPRGHGPEAEQQLTSEIDEIVRTCRALDIKIPRLEEYWTDLWKTFGRALQRSVTNHQAQRALDELRMLGQPPAIAPLNGEWRGRVYGFVQLFSTLGDSDLWTDKMTRTVLRATMSEQPTVLFVRRMVGRNIKRHASGDSVIEESTRWVIQLHVRGASPQIVPCVFHRRNFAVRWTTRLDWRLPAQADGARYPFCPLACWWKRDTEMIRTMESRPVWIDRMGNGWARPNIRGGRGHHWDVYVTDTNLVERIGLHQLNIVEFGAPPRQGAPGSIHHVPGKKKSRLREDSGWSCE